MTLGENLRRLRKEKGLSQEEVAQALFLSRQSVSKWENDGAEPGVENLKALARLYEVTVDELLGIVLQPEKSTINHRKYYELVTLRVVTALLIALFALMDDGSADLPLDMLALTAGIWITEPFMWVLTVCLEICNIFFGAVLLVADGNLIAALSILVNGSCILLLCQSDLRRRFRIKQL